MKLSNSLLGTRTARPMFTVERRPDEMRRRVLDRLRESSEATFFRVSSNT